MTEPTCRQVEGMEGTVIDVFLYNGQGVHSRVSLRTSDDTIDAEDYGRAVLSLGGVSSVKVDLPCGRFEADLVFEGQEPGRIGVAV